MANSFTLDDIRAAADRKYGNTDIAGVTFRNVLRLSKDERNKFIETQKQMSNDDADQEALIRELLTLAAADKHQVNELLSNPLIDLAVLAEMLEAYGKGSEAGEASASQN